jgi:hypothetical protein
VSPDGSGLERLRAELRDGGGLLADSLRPNGAAEHEGEEGPAQLASSGPRVARRRAAYELLVEAIREGYLLHYGRSRILAVDPDMALLAGDRLYALGLAHLSRLGDLEATAELADVISLAAQAHATGDPDLADAVWEAGAAAVGWGPTPELRTAKELARRGAEGAAEALRSAAESARAETAARR